MKDGLKIKVIRRLWLISEFRRVIAGDCRSFVNGLPALLIGGASCVFAWHLSSVPEDQRLALYVQGAALATKPGNHESAILCTERLIQESQADPKQRFVYATILQTDGNLAGAESILSQLAPTAGKGYAPAHLALARLLLRSKGAREEPTVRTIERHLEFALGAPEIADEARILLGRIYAATGRRGQAEPILRAAAERHPELLLILARLASDEGDKMAASADLDSAIRAFRNRALARVDEVEARLLWADALSARSDFGGAVAVLEQGLTHSTDLRYRQALARAYANMANAVAGKDSPAVSKRLALLEKGFGHAPNDPALLDQLAAIIRVGGTDIGRARSILQSQLTQGKATVTTHFLLGWDALSRGRVDEARVHWDQALRLAPDSAVLANNLAWVLASAEPSDLPRALTLANRAIERERTQPDFRHTRGMVLMKLKRWPDALTDLEVALAGRPDSGETHRALAEVYEKLGSREIASQHRDLANSPSKQATATVPAASQVARPY